LNTRLRNEFFLILLGNVILIGLIAADIKGLPNPLAILRLILGLIYVLFIPGYTLQLLLFPRRSDLDNTERIALSFALSGVIVAPIFLLLNWLPWGITMWSVVISLSLFILACLIGSTIRHIHLPAWERFDPRTSFSLRNWWANQERTNRFVLIILAVTLATAFLTAFSILVMPKPAERFTEFYILGSEGLAEDYPRKITAGQVVIVTTGITNREGDTSLYNIRVMLDDQVIGQAGPLPLEDGATWEQSVEFTLPKAGDDQQVELILEREGQPSPYRTLRLWLNVTPSEAP
jgi:uncharacterized membrane protein